ncbi:single-stranded-DNA-specific exonuclease RecJ [Anaerotignum sp.]|uniref:single-stranded-DNA-specific exonuclease RecJ n=1 Tax=Anaerotignum sp. TaxID=2039241 RepID=UPI0028ABAD25|nr:single-stranded-DNA-specific exonuclease RecJ [Anaerotignum sp.]
MKRWLLKRSKIDTTVMARELGVREAVACVLANRGLGERQLARNFIYGTIDDLRKPYLMKDMELAINLIKQAIIENKKIAVYGDYDVDGVMSTTILFRGILRCGGEAVYYVPHRQKEGYGLNLEAIEQLAKEGVNVLFTCDNGIAALEETKRAKELGMDVVVLDHHEPGFREIDGVEVDVLPTADAVVDPKQRECTYPFAMLCAGGISYKFIMALLQAFEIQDDSLEREFLSFAAIATVCDIVDLLDENRVLVRSGLEEIQKTTNMGLKVLLQETGVSDKLVSEYHLGFIIGPCINATGRLESGKKAVELFCEKDENKAREIAKTLIKLNEERKNLTVQAAQRAVERIEKEGLLKDKVLVLYDEDTHESIAGIVAGRIKERYYRPVIMITAGEEGAKGSGRSIEGYNLFQALFCCRALFTRFGGHAMAAGLSLPQENIPLLREKLNQECQLTTEEMTPVLRLDKQLLFSEIDLELAKELEMLAPFGKENHSPLFGSKNISVDRMDLIGKNKDILRMTLSDGVSGKRFGALSFAGYDQMLTLLKELYPEEECVKMMSGGKISRKFDFVYSIEINTYNGRSSVQLMIKDFRLSK